MVMFSSASSVINMRSTISHRIRTLRICKFIKVSVSILRNVLKKQKKLICAYLVTFGLILPLLCHHLRNTSLEFLYNRNQTAAAQAMIRENTARFEQSLKSLQRFEDRKTFCQTLPFMCSMDRTRQGTALFASDTKSDALKKPSPMDDSLAPTHGFHRVQQKRTYSRDYFKGGLAISVVTVARTSKYHNYTGHYLPQTVARLLEIISVSEELMERTPVHLSVCNVDFKANAHSDIKLLPVWIPVSQRFKIEPNKTDLTQNELIDKEKNDYVFCINKSLELNFSYVMIVEDDALANANLFDVLKRFFVSERFAYTDEIIFNPISNYAFLKLYHPERLLGYFGFDAERIPELVSLSIILTTLTLLIRTIVQGSAFNHFYLCHAINAFLMFLLGIMVIGRSNINALRTYSDYLYYITPAPSCCSPAILFPRAGAVTIVTRLEPMTCKAGFAKDSAIDQIVKEDRLQTRLVQPNLFQHIGHYSSLRKDMLNPFIV
ncbi:post-GPI attachment to proteins factor 4-like isoform X2 [Dreissena polymorpha]|uniref:Transmembrane protein 246 n=2 Tax=Dreissena polymorpha TaxID=45954 RepID=A0A9D4F006_DREPO|nr:post-GPI attachment to proteins factor 4-like isoform X2 [Dreissena polymorpha]KAH3789895.1 hypothetical protein DPMN_168084 [Dreissena polymorpha]